MQSTVRYQSFPRTQPPPRFVELIAGVFRKNESGVGTRLLQKGLTSDGVLELVRTDLEGLGFQVESGKQGHQKIHRPVLYGEGGVPTMRYEIDAYHSEWRCGLEVEAGRGWMGNAVYRDLILASLMVDVDHFILAVANEYRYQSSGKTLTSRDYENATTLADTIFSQGRFALPFSLTVVGY